MEKEEFFNLFLNIKKETNNFRIVPRDVIRKSPQALLALRIALRLGRKPFGDLVGLSKRRLWSYETGKVKMLPKNVAAKLAEALSVIFSKSVIEMDEVAALNQYKMFKGFAHMDTRRAREIRSRVSSEKNMLKGINSELSKKPKNYFEERIIKILESHNIPFEFHALLHAKNKPVVVDFVIPNEKEPQIVIEVKQACSQNRRSRYGRLKYYVILLGHKIHHLKLKHPDLIGVVIVSDMHTPFQEVSLSAKAELLATDALFLDFNLPQLPAYIQSVYQGQTIKSA